MLVAFHWTEVLLNEKQETALEQSEPETQSLSDFFLKQILIFKYMSS